jgi:hypothetical protein
VNNAVVLDGIAQTLSRVGDPSIGATLMGAAATIRERANAKLTASEQASRDETLRACRVALGEAAFADVWAKGCVLTLEQAVRPALEPVRLPASMQCDTQRRT